MGKSCRVCNKVLLGEEGVDWVKRSQGYYYHNDCWEEFIDPLRSKTESEWLDLIFYVITHLLKKRYNFHQIKAQFEKQLREGMTAKGIYYTVYWYFVLQEKEWKSDFGLGIVPHIYDDSCQFWVEQGERQLEMQKQIESYKFLEEVTVKVGEKKRRQPRLKDIASPF